MHRLPRFLLAAAAICLLALFVVSCRTPAAPQPTPNPGPPAQTCQPGTAGQYFPYRPGMVAAFAGKGNEFASWTIRILYQEGTLMEWRRDTGGTTMAEVFLVEPDRVTRVHGEGEAYDDGKRLLMPPDKDQVVLQSPVAVGTEWTSEGVARRIVAVDETVEAAGQSLTCVVVVEEKHEGSTIRNYYHKDYGWILSAFRPNEGEGEVESRLESLTSP